MKGDHKSRLEQHDIPRTPQFTQCCDGCAAVVPYARCVTPELVYTDCTDSAAWRLTVFSDAAYLLHAATPSPWAAVPGWSLSRSHRDLLHNLHLGVGGGLSTQRQSEYVGLRSIRNELHACWRKLARLSDAPPTSRNIQRRRFANWRREKAPGCAAAS